MKAKIIKLGNSHGIILPTQLLKQLKLSTGSTVDLEIHNGTIVIKPAPRQGWAEAAKQMNDFDKDEWTW